MMEKYYAQIPDQDYWSAQIKCQAACPVQTDARGYIQAIARGDYEEAYLIARAPNPLASICGQICGAPCEINCRRADIDDPISIRALKRFVTERFGPEAGVERSKKIAEWLRQNLAGGDPGDAGTRPLFDLQTRGDFPRAAGQRVAIIGSGPAGLAAAHDLALMGFQPVIFEMEPVPAGMLYLGVPEYRLPREIIDAEVEFIRSLGVEIRCDTTVGKDISFPELQEEFSAIIIAVGAKKSRRLTITGADAPLVLGGVEFLRDVSLGKPVQLGEKVVVIGGGNVAFDIGRTVIRQTEMDVSFVASHFASVSETHICCLESREEMPADDIEVIEGSEEGIRLHTGWGPKEIHVENGEIRGVTFVRCTRVFDEKKRFSPRFDDTETKTLECDTVLVAIGQQFDIAFIDAGRDGIELLPNGAPKIHPGTMETTHRGVYVAGDLAHGTKLMIHAIASGKQAARSIYHQFMNETLAPQTVNLHIPIRKYERIYDYEQFKRIILSTLSPEERVYGQSQVELSLTEPLAQFEAKRCFDCGINTIFDGEKCILCGGCVDICPSVCLKIVGFEELVLDESLVALRDQLLGEEEGAAILKDEDTCIRCGLCALRCPTTAITMERYRCEELI